MMSEIEESRRVRAEKEARERMTRWEEERKELVLMSSKWGKSGEQEAAEKIKTTWIIGNR